MAKYLDGTGLSTAFGLIKNWVTANFSPIPHDSTATTYGKGTDSKYGHVKLSDSTSSTTAASSGGTAATPKAVKDALDAAKTYADGKADTNTTYGLSKTGSTITLTGSDGSTSSVTDDDTQYGVFLPGTGGESGSEGLVPPPPNGLNKLLFSSATWHSLATSWNPATLELEFFKDSVSGSRITGQAFTLASSTSHGFMDKTDKANLDALVAAGPEANVQSDWNQGDTTADDYIKNKPTIPTVPGDFTGATSSAAGAHGLVPAPNSGGTSELLWGNGTWDKLFVNFSAGSGTGANSLYMELKRGDAGYYTKQLIPVATTSLAGLMSKDDKTKLNGIAAGAEVNVQSNWTQTNSSADDYIKNKPTLGAAAAKNIGSVTDGNTDLVTGDAVYDAIQGALSDVAGALVYKGTAATASAISGTNYKKGWYWIASDTFALTSSINVEPGDMIIAKQDKTSTFANDIDVVQTNIETLTTAEVTALWNAA